MSVLRYSPSSHSCTESYLEDLALDVAEDHSMIDDCTDYEFDEYFIEDDIYL